MRSSGSRTQPSRRASSGCLPTVRSLFWTSCMADRRWRFPRRSDLRSHCLRAPWAKWSWPHGTGKNVADFLSKSALPAFTAASIINPDTYERSIDEAITRGAAIDVDEYVDGVRAAAAPVMGPGQKLVAIIWVAGFSRHIDSGRLDFIASAVAREAAEISRRMSGN